MLIILLLFIDPSCVFATEDVEITSALGDKKVQDFVNSDDPEYLGAGRQALFSASSQSQVKSTSDLFGHDCNLAWNLEARGGEINFTSPNYGKGSNYPTNFSCHLSFTGSERCVPNLSCDDKIDVRASLGSPCANEYLQVSDGLGGEQRWCGGAVFSAPVKPTSNARDLYVKIRTSEKPIKKDQVKQGFRCTVTCAGNDSKAVPLQKVDYSMKTVHQCVCGYQNKEDRIVGGVDALENEFPWLAAIVMKGTRNPVCGGSLINDRWILTAAHCFFNTNYSSADLDILLHADLLDMLVLDNANEEAALGQKGSIKGAGWDKKAKSDKDEHTLRHEIERVIIHPLYSKKYDYDVALVQITPKIDFLSMNAPTPICLPKIGVYKNINYLSLNLTVAGWGKSHEKAGASTRKLQKLENVPPVDSKKCAELLPKYQITDRMLCAGFLEGNKDACTGDSGGPFMYREEGSPPRLRQIGIVSFGSGCARKNSPGIYTRLTDLSQWIVYHANQVGPKWCRDAITLSKK